MVAAQYKGSGDETGQRETVGTLFSIAFIASIIVTVAGLHVYEPLFRVLNVPLEAMADACSYMEIICWGTVFVFGYNAVCSIMKGLGDSKSPLYFVAAAAAVNVALDIILVFFFKCTMEIKRSCLCHCFFTGHFPCDFRGTFKEKELYF